MVVHNQAQSTSPGAFGATIPLQADQVGDADFADALAGLRAVGASADIEALVERVAAMVRLKGCS